MQTSRSEAVYQPRRLLLLLLLLLLAIPSVAMLIYRSSSLSLSFSLSVAATFFVVSARGIFKYRFDAHYMDTKRHAQQQLQQQQQETIL